MLCVTREVHMHRNTILLRNKTFSGWFIVVCLLVYLEGVGFFCLVVV